MSKLSLKNIDLWLFEYAEGNLSEAQIAELKLFLLSHPELESEKDLWQDSKMPQAEYVFPDQNKLKRKPIGLYYAADFIAAFVVLAFLVFNVQQDKTIAAFQKIGITESDPNPSNESLDFNGYKLGKQNNKQRNSIDLSENMNTVKVDENSNYATITNDIVAVNNKKEINKSRTEEVISSQIDNTNLLAAESGNTPVLKTFKVRPVKIPGVNKTISRGQVMYGIYSSSGNYKSSMRSKINQLSRTLQRMLDNPIALTNYKDPNYHVPGMTQNDISFSSAGNMLASRVQAFSRLQWFERENEQLMNQLSIDSYAYGIRGGWSLQLNHSMYNRGGLNLGSAAITYSPKFSINRKISFEPAVRFKMGNKFMNYELMEYAEKIEMERGNVYEFYPNGTTPLGNDLWFKDIGAGFLLNTEWFFTGVQVDNLLHHKDNFFNSEILNPHRAGSHVIATIGTDYQSSRENMSLSPYFVYQNYENFAEGWFGVNYRINWFTCGAAISTQYDAGASIGMKFEHFALMANSDYTLSAMTGQRDFSYQLSLRFNGNRNQLGKRLQIP